MTHIASKEFKANFVFFMTKVITFMGLPPGQATATFVNTQAVF